MPLMFKDNKLLFVGGKLAMALACCCGVDVTPKACGDCGMSATSQFQVAITGVGTVTCSNNLAYSPASNCVWGYNGSAGACGTIETAGVQWNASNGGWNVSYQLTNAPSFGVWQSATNEQFLGCGPWTVTCNHVFGTSGACAATTGSHIATVTLIP